MPAATVGAEPPVECPQRAAMNAAPAAASYKKALAPPAIAASVTLLGAVGNSLLVFLRVDLISRGDARP